MMFSGNAAHNDIKLHPRAAAFSTFESSKLEISNPMDPNLPVSTGKLQDCPNCLGARERHHCTKAPYSDDFSITQRKHSQERELELMFPPSVASSWLDSSKEP